MQYYRFLSAVHDLVAPREYLEIGIRNGHSLALAKCHAVGIDPAYWVTAEFDGPVSLFRTTSDEYFARPDPLACTGGRPFDLAFLDGLHLFEFAFRDFVHTEQNSTPTSVIVFDDVLPRTNDEAARQRHTSAWTGDVFRMIEVLDRFRPEVSAILVDTRPTGLMIVVGLDPADTVLADNYDAIMADHRRPDPQEVPRELLERTTVQSAERVLAAGFWKLLVDHRDNAGPDFHWRLREQLCADFGRAYEPPS
jgi:hypothetical protein